MFYASAWVKMYNEIILKNDAFCLQINVKELFNLPANKLFHAKIYLEVFAK